MTTGGPGARPTGADGGRGGRPRLDSAFWFLVVLVLVTGAIAVVEHGGRAIVEALRIVVADGLLIIPLVVLGVLVGSLFTMLVPREVIARFLGAQAGLRGILFASFLGAVMPGGPFASFPLVYALGRSGAGLGALVAFLIAWAAVGFSRLITWELPFMGAEFAALRVASSLPLPVIAGLLADRLSRRFPGIDRDWE